MRRALLPFALALALAALAGCAGLEGLRPGADGAPPPGGVAMLYPQPQSEVFDAALRILPGLSLYPTEINQERGFILAERGVNAMSYGENVGLYLAPQGAGTLVTVLSRRKMATNVAAKDFAMPVHMALGAALGAARK